tara:strand:- start:393 stop:593 length:201 start_codon:yes stop_codon:yes gene_type:complete
MRFGVEILALLALGFIIPLVSMMNDHDEPRRVLRLSLHYFFILTGITLILCAVIGCLEWIFIRPLL